PPLEIGAGDYLTVCETRVHIHAHDVLTNSNASPGDRRAGGNSRPVVLGNVGRSHRRQGERQLVADAVVAANRALQVNVGEKSASRIGLDAPGAGCATEDGEVRQVNRVILLRGGVMMPNGCG